MSGLDKNTLDRLETIARFYRGASRAAKSWGDGEDEWTDDAWLLKLAMSAHTQLDLGKGPLLRELGRWDGVVKKQAQDWGDRHRYTVTAGEVIKVYEQLIEKHHEQMEAEHDGA